MSIVADKPRLRCLVFSDLVGSTELKSRLGDRAASALISRHQAAVRRLLGETGGREIDDAGDGFFLTFQAPSDALRFALRLQQLHLESPGLPAVRVGIHLGEVREREAPGGSSKPIEVVGLAVDLASRIQTLARPGQVLMSAAVATAARPQLRAGDLGNLCWHAYGPYRFKGVDTPVEIEEVTPAESSPGGTPPDSEKAWRVAVPGNLPALLSPFLGRQRELEALVDAVAAHRLVTVVGAAGAGKTRTVLEAAGRVAADYRGGGWLVELGPHRTEADLLPAVARVLQVTPDPGSTAVDTLVDALRYRPSLLVLDNCEHLLSAVAELAETLVSACPDLHVIATSREPLHSRAEHVFALAPLETRAEPGGVSEAVALFIERATAEGAMPAKLEGDREVIEELCHRLDGLPLAIELAASRARSLGPRQLLAHLDERFRFLKSSRRSTQARHETLHSAIDESYRHLAADERSLFDRLSLFAAPFELTDAAALMEGRDEWLVLDQLEGLVDQS
ncbi:MAG: adenylate/guanylate cyclase domain-containing protein, partial [Thermoanaerobaculia bacterium]|nr:adenylate/guanylate cyclase domain-containing protein [Thermoanaerobaculia bacterium]